MLSTKTIMKNNSQDNIFQNIHTSNVEQNYILAPYVSCL